MSILIKGIEIPEDNTVLLRIYPESEGVFYVEQLDIDDDILDKYWAIHIPPHGRLIDADAFTKDECNYCDGACEALPCDCLNCKADCRCDFMKDIADAPTIIPAEEGE